MIDFGDRFDALLAQQGPPAVFTVTADLELRLHPDRTRDAWQRLGDDAVPTVESCHCLFRDRATGWVQYILVTSPVLCAEHPRADIWRYESQAAALAALEGLGAAGVWRGEGRP